MFVLAHRMLMNGGKEEAWNAIIRGAEIKPKYMSSKAFKAKIEFIDFQFLGSFNSVVQEFLGRNLLKAVNCVVVSLYSCYSIYTI